MLVNVLMLAAASKSLNCWGGIVGSITTTSNPDLIFAQGACGAMWYDVSDKANPHLASLPHYTKGGPSAVYLDSTYSATSSGDIVAVFPGDAGFFNADYVVLYSVDTREALAAVNLSTSVGGMTDVAVHNNLLFVVGSKGLAVVNATTGAVVFSDPFPSDSYTQSVKVSPEAKLLYTYDAPMGERGTVTIRSLDTWTPLSSFQLSGVTKILTPTGSPTEVYFFSSHYLTKVNVADPAKPFVVGNAIILSYYIVDIVWTDVLVVAMHNAADPPDEVCVLDPLNGFSITARSNNAGYLYNAHLAVGDTGVIYCVVGESKLVVFEQQGSDLVMSGESETSIVGPSAAVEIKPDVMAVAGRQAVYIVDTHDPMPKVLATESAGNYYDSVMCFSRKHALLLVQEEHDSTPYYLVAYDVSDPAAPTTVWRKQVDELSSCAATEDVFLLTLEDSDPTNVEVVDVTTGEKTDTVVVDRGVRRGVGVSRGYLFFSSEGDVKAFHISESLQAEPLPDLPMNSSTGNFAYGTDTSMCVAQCDLKSRPGPLSIVMYDTQRDSGEVEEPVQQLDYTNATMSLFSGQTMVVQDYSGKASMMLIYDTSTSPITLLRAVQDEDLVIPNFVMGDTFYLIGGQTGSITFYNPELGTPTPAPAPATPAPATPAPAPATPAPVTSAPDTFAAGVPWFVVVGSVVFFAAAGFAGGWFLKSKMKVREVDQNLGLSDEIVNDDVQEVE